ncbi:MAG: tetratricopeptide repeat protein [Vicinamibacterales bacterium]
MGWILIEGDRPDDALQHFASAARRNPMLAEAVVGIGIVSLQRGRLDEADQALQRAAKLEPGNPRLAKARAQLDAMKSRTGGRE